VAARSAVESEKPVFRLASRSAVVNEGSLESDLSLPSSERRQQLFPKLSRPGATREGRCGGIPDGAVSGGRLATS